MVRFSLLVALLVCAQCHAASPVWKVSKNGNHFYLGGTIHLLAANDYPLPAAFEQAYGEASEVILETDLRDTKRSDFQTQLLRHLMYPPGQTLRDKLRPDTFARLDNFMASRGVPTRQIIRFKAGMAIMTLTVIELKRHGLATEGVDSYYMNKAAADNKPLGELERLGEQMVFIANMGVGQEDEIIRHTLDDLEEIPTMMRDLKAAWRKGDGPALEKLGIDEWRRDYPKVYNSLLVERNNNWMEHLDEFAADPDVELVLVGALHLVGEDGLLKKLRAKGYQLQQLP
ncbi:MAG: TraB/GumN family protein [Cellvibrionaceae bacterium]|nr:TraB/GumN family protein [Cellvibrionaceae bacterium]